MVDIVLHHLQTSHGDFVTIIDLPEGDHQVTIYTMVSVYFLI